MTTPTAALVEEAEREIAHMKAEALSAENPYTEDTIRLTLLIDVVAALRRAEAERDAQHAEVLRLTGELEALATKTGDVAWREDAAVEVVKMRGRQIAELLKTIEELRAQVWGLICAGSNMAKAKRYYQGLWETLRDAGLKGDAQLSELTATRDLLTEENARLQERVATLELLLRGGK